MPLPDLPVGVKSMLPPKNAHGRKSAPRALQKRKTDIYTDSDASSSYEPPKKKGRKRSGLEEEEDGDEDDEDDLVLDLAPADHNTRGKQIRSGSVHIGLDVHVKWHKFRGAHYVMTRHMVNGVVDGRRGININMQYLPNLKKAIDKAHECYMEAQ